MPLRVIVAYLLILLLAGGVVVAVRQWIRNSPREQMRRYYRERHRHPKR